MPPDARQLRLSGALYYLYIHARVALVLNNANPISAIATLGFATACVAGVAAAVCGPAYRLELLPLGAAFTLLRWTAYGALVAVAISVVGMLVAGPGRKRRGFILALLGAVIGLAVFWIPYKQYRTAAVVPAIHDITTDTADPPGFGAIVALRADSPNTHIYGGAKVAAQQRVAYPDIQPLRFEIPPGKIFDAAVRTAHELNWDVVAASAVSGIIEATDTTAWFGFKDDVVIRIRPAATATVVDVRSVSRVGRSDLGKNAQRVRMFVDELRKSIE
ncbi:DUF1499 domain-containing protein [Gammaproteobacteria bacterium]|nr:DUF1499 domain-containing protein [Gammaproteobacteria bacterium]